MVIFLLAAGSFKSNAQKYKKLPEAKIDQSFVEKHIRFLASDALMGRNTGEQGNNAAAAYIAEEFRSYGVAQVNGSYFQEIPFVRYNQPKGAQITVGDSTLKINDDFLLLNGGGLDISSAPVARVGYGWFSEDGSYNDYEGQDVTGKVVIAQIGTPFTKSFREMMSYSSQKAAIAKSKGALAMIEVFTIPAPWELLTGNFGDGRIDIKAGESDTFTRILVNATTARRLGNETLSIQCGKLIEKSTPSNNVVGLIRGTDPDLSSTYVALTAHYDHVGFREPEGEGDDYIFNGARDNAIGVAGLLTAAKSLAEKPAKRSILLIAFTGEELGLKGSKFYVENPLLPVKQTVFNLNIDGAGYNDTSIISGMGVLRTGAEPEITQAVEALGLKLLNDPSPELGLFDRSDNVNFAILGVPAPTFTPGFTSFSEDMLEYYHKEADNAESLDFAYCTKFVKSYAFAARLVGNKKTAPQWIAGDKYEAAAKKLYQQ